MPRNRKTATCSNCYIRGHSAHQCRMTVVEVSGAIFRLPPGNMPPQVRVGAGLTTATTATPDAADAGVVDGRVEKEDGVGPQVLRALLDRASKMTEAQWQQLLAARPAAATVDPADSADRADPPDLATTAAPLTTTTTAAAAAAAAAAATTTTGRSAATTAAAVQRQREDLEKQTVSDVE